MCRSGTGALAHRARVIAVHAAWGGRAANCSDLAGFVQGAPVNAISVICAAMALSGPVPVPEPGTMFLLGAGLIILAIGLRRFRAH